ncbi:LLM class flavin-dependent oxidoreductase [Actinosynnema sp. NPDC020468]|uniref:LLM class flavin-dependent oxidoreductase n=1 Tax=Actinosynnema sp. NPDC020468 TaxID=3154488 RepID=UPI0033DD2931
MALRVHWFVPSHGDGRDLAGPGRREPDIGYLTAVARAADDVGFHGALIPFGLFCADPFVVTAALAGATRRLRPMVALRPGLVSPLLAAQQIATLQQVCGGRLALNIVIGGDADEQLRYGDTADHDRRYARADEFLTVLRELWRGDPVRHHGEFYRLDNAFLVRPHEFPELYVGGSSPQARRVAARHADCYLAWGETPAALAALRAELPDPAPRFGTRLHVITRDTAEEAWAAADELVAGIDPALIARTRARFARSESHGQRRAVALRADGLTPCPNYWLGFGLARPGAGTALVGSHAEVADRIRELHDLGVADLILSGQPHLEEAHRVGEGVLPLLRAAGVLAD